MKELPNYLPTQFEMYGVKQEAPKYYQGDDIIIPIFELIDTAKYTLHAYLKAELDGPGLVWEGSRDDGIVLEDGFVIIKIRASTAQTFLPGIYYLTLAGSTDRDVNTRHVLTQLVFSITPAASSNYFNININNRYCNNDVGRPIPNYVGIQYFSAG